MAKPRSDRRTMPPMMPALVVLLLIANGQMLVVSLQPVC